MLLWIAEINRHYGLAESLLATVKRPWYDLLAFRVAMNAEQRIVERLRAKDG